MRNILLLLFVITAGCINSQEKSNQTTLSQTVSEDFSFFYSKFYSDTSYQSERTLKPLRGTIKEWDDDVVKEESWDNKKVTMAPKEKFLQIYKNLKSDLIKKDTLVIEKYWIEQSGFQVEKKFILKSGKWYLYSYDLSNL
ncbi:MAG: hypothetical protein A2066_02215 [Bacteroidetes bacterium GWB2_41_8]|nr:MAG: hypothetical protein A2066_02215 [Bacteroidetes bacterium GWB2_41_8]